MSGEYSRWIRTSWSSCISFCLVFKKHAVLNYPNKDYAFFCWLILDTFHWVWLQLIWLGSVLVGINNLIFQKELIIEDSLLIPPYIHHFFWLETGLWCGWWWFISLALWSFPFHITVTINFSFPITICFGNGTLFIMFQ